MHFITSRNASPSHTHNSKGRRKKDSKLCYLSCLSEESLGSVLPIRYWCKAQLRTASEVQLQCSGSGCPYRLWSQRQTHRHRYTYTQTLSHALFLIFCTLSARKKNNTLRSAIYLEILNTTTASPNFSTCLGHLILSSALSHFLSALQMPGQLPGQGLAARTQPCVEATGALVCPLGLLSSEVCSPKRQA